MQVLGLKKMPELIPVLSKDDIDKRISVIAHRISNDYKNDELVFIGVLKGSFIFLSDIVRCLTIPVRIDFVGISSYGSGIYSSGNIRLTKKIELNVRDKDLLIIEDIIDTGSTLSYLIDYLNSFDPKTVKVCVLLDKSERRDKKINVDYVCHKVKKGFFVGYGLDYNENYRNLQGIYCLKL